MPYIGNQPGTGVRNRFIYTATASQTTFTGADNNSKTLKYSDADYIDVYLNGVCLVPVTDYAASTKTSVVLTQAASLNDTLEVVAYDIATISDTVSKADGGTFNGDLGITNASPDITLTNNTTEDTDGGRESTVTFKGLQSGGEESTLAEIRASHDATADDQKGDLIFKTNDGSDGASPTERVRVDSAGFVGINESSPSGTLHVKGTSAAHGKVIVEAGGSGGSANNNFIEFNKHDGTKLAEIEVGESVTNGGDIIFKTTPTGGSVTNRIRLRHDGGICFGTDNAEANALNDYEEGSYTPAFATSGGGAITISTVYGRYRKIGNLVYVIAGFTNQSTSASGYSGSLTCTLPFNADDLGGGYRDMTSVVANIGVFSSGGAGIVGMVDSATQVFFYAQGSTGWGTPSISGDATGKYFHFSLCYRTAT